MDEIKAELELAEVRPGLTAELDVQPTASPLGDLWQNGADAASMQAGR